LDGVRIRIAANISQPDTVHELKQFGAEGIGLFRTEFLYMGRETPPSEQEQFEAYRQVLEAFAPEPVVIRTLDIGGDKDLPYLDIGREENPFLGFRALRYCLSHQDIFRLQLRALLRASVHGNLKIMFPMVTNLTEVQMAYACLEEARQELLREGTRVSDDIEIGIMVETPAAAMISEILAKEVDFFSIGTNDLTQYTLAVDRHNEKVAPMYDSFHPAVIKLIERTVASAHAAGIWVGLCGEMAGDPLAVPLLLGLGLNELSMNAPAIPWVKEKVRCFTMRAAEDIARQALELKTGTEVRQFLASIVGSGTTRDL
jgi:phosphotransferase system enzyme I (PtsI)